MKFLALALVAATGALLVDVDAQYKEQPQSVPDSYYPAFYAAGAAFTGEQKLMIFPPGKEAVSLPLPFPLGRFTYAPTGNELYAQAFVRNPDPWQPGIYKIKFNPISATRVPIALDLRLHNITVAPDGKKLLVSGGYQDGPNQHCGVFQIGLPEGTVEPVLETPSPDCRYGSGWISLSLSPRGEQAVGIYNGRLELIDLIHRETRLLAHGFLKAAWSPNGRWIAALQSGGKSRTVLFDATEFSKTRILGNSEVEWSPDSRYLLCVNSHGCGDESGTIDALDVETGKRLTIKSSKCQVYQTTTGWVSSNLISGDPVSK